MPKYNPDSAASRTALAASITARLTEMGFSPFFDKRWREVIYSRPVHTSPGVTVLVYTSCAPAPDGRVKARRAGRDAIRVCAIYATKDGETRGIARAEKRVNRVGDIEDIVERMYQRAREVYKTAMNPCRCGSCGAPLFMSKKGNEVCSDRCWLSDEERSRPAPRHPRRSFGQGYRRRRRSSYVSTAYDIECALNGVAP